MIIFKPLILFSRSLIEVIVNIIFLNKRNEYYFTKITNEVNLFIKSIRNVNVYSKTPIVFNKLTICF